MAKWFLVQWATFCPWDAYVDFLLRSEVIILCECVKNWELGKCSVAGNAILTLKAVADLELTHINLCCLQESTF